MLEKYIDDPDAERIEAFVMGWDGLLGAMADREESAAAFDFEYEMEDWPYGDEEEDEDDGEDEEEEEAEEHPLQKQAHDIALRSLSLVSSAQEEGEAGHLTTSRLMRISAKLAGALNCRSADYEPEQGFVLAVLKRCLNWTNEALGGCNQLLVAELGTDQATALEQLRSDIFELRDGIIEMRRLLKQN